MGRRKRGELIAIEVEILLEVVRLSVAGQHEFHGFAMAKELRDDDGSDG